MKYSTPTLIAGALTIFVVGFFFAMLFLDRKEAPEQTPVANEESTDETTTATEAESMPESRIVGSWHLTQDERAVLTFYSDGTFDDRQGEDIIAGGSWELLNEESNDPALAGVEGSLFLRLADQNEVIYFTVANLSADQLALVHLVSGDAFVYERN